MTFYVLEMVNVDVVNANVKVIGWGRIVDVQNPRTSVSAFTARKNVLDMENVFVTNANATLTPTVAFSPAFIVNYIQMKQNLADFWLQKLNARLLDQVTWMSVKKTSLP